MTNPRVLERPLPPEEAIAVIGEWLDEPNTWVPEPGAGYPLLFADLVSRYRVTGDLVPDAMLAALALEHGLDLASTDTDFARFSGLRWINPLA